ncbi:MAG: TonB-dependent receptor plug domain-containing protein [Myxococcota bacterium]
MNPLQRGLVLCALAMLSRNAGAQENGEAPEVIEVRGQSRETSLEDDSAKAVSVITLEDDRVRSTDLGELLARSTGVSVQRTGGLGSAAVISLNGLRNQQVRFFLDGVPLDAAGFPFGLANVPVNLIQNVEVYRGVVPIEFGADALGGAINLTSRQSDTSEGDASYQFGSFNTHRAVASARVTSDDDRWFAKATGFYDFAANDYSITVDESGIPLTVDRINGEYEASGARLRFGLREWGGLRRLDATVYYSESVAGIPHNQTMGVPFGEAEADIAVVGLTTRYLQEFGDDWDLDLLFSASRERRELLDVTECVYIWTGECVLERLNPTGELQEQESDSLIDTTRLYSRATVLWRPDLDNSLRVSITPDVALRTGDNRLVVGNDRDLLDSDRRLLTLVGGVEWESNLLDGDLQSLVFAKSYIQRVRSDEPGLSNEDRFTRRASADEPGVGASLRYVVTSWLTTKASYEWAARLPNATEYFGDNQFTAPNLDLVPERSQNGNVTMITNLEEPGLGALRFETTGFLRDASNWIIFFPRTETATYRNVLGARSYGLEASLDLRTANDGIAVGANATLLELRNTSDGGEFADFRDDRIPNRPYRFANGYARVQFDDVFQRNSVVRLDWNTRFVGEFFRTWESQGQTGLKQTIDAQLQHSAAAIYTVQRQYAELAFSVEAINLTDTNIFDFFGAQRPGRSLFTKVTGRF